MLRRLLSDLPGIQGGGLPGMQARIRQREGHQQSPVLDQTMLFQGQETGNMRRLSRICVQEDTRLAPERIQIQQISAGDRIHQGKGI